MSMGFALGGMVAEAAVGVVVVAGKLALATVEVCGVVALTAAKAGAKGIALLGKAAYKMGVRVAYGVSEIIGLFKESYNEYKEVRGGYDERAERIIKKLNENTAKAEKWIENKEAVTFTESSSAREKRIKTTIETILENEDMVTYETLTAAEKLNESWKRASALGKAEKNKLIEDSLQLIADMENDTRLHLAAIKALMDEDITADELENVNESINKVVSSTQFIDKLCAMVDLVDELDEKDTKCTKPHGNLGKSLKELYEKYAGGFVEETDDVRIIEGGLGYSDRFAPDVRNVQEDEKKGEPKKKAGNADTENR